MIFRARSRWVIALSCVAIAVTALARAEFVWTGLGLNSNWTTPANWQGDVAPFNDGGDQILFGSASRTSVIVNTPQNVLRIRFDFSGTTIRSYSLSGISEATLTLGAEGIAVIAGSSPIAALTSSVLPTGGAVTFDSALGVVLGASQTWSVDPASSLEIAGTVTGAGTLTVSGGGAVELSGNNTYSGGTVLAGGSLAVEHDAALGTGPLTVTGTAAIYSNSGARTLANALNLNSSLLDLLPYGGDLRLNGAVTLGSSVTLRNDGQPVYISGAVGESGGSRSLTVSGRGAIVLSGTNTYTGGSAVTGGALFFSNANAVPATGLLSNTAQGYTGIGFNTGVHTGFIAKFSGANTSGTIGFDTNPGAASATIFTETVDLTGFSTLARLGSATRATLSSTAVITPVTAAGYRFGGGGGTLTLESVLTGSNSLTVDSSASGLPLTLKLSNTGNDYTGSTSVTGSALVFGTGAMPARSPDGSFSLGNGGYIGSSDPNLAVATWLAKFASTNVTGVIGIDSADVNNPRTINDGFDLGAILSGTSITLGTSSAATLVGAISLPPTQTDYYLTGYKGGWLTVNSVLAGAHGLRIGHAQGDYPEFDPNDLSRMSTVFLNGANSHTAGTTLYSGRLVLGQENALGTGVFTVDGSGANVLPRLETSLTTSPTFTNQLVVNDDFEIGGVNAFVWAGNIVDGVTTGNIQKYGAFNLTLTGINSAFSGGFQINEGTITFGSDTAAGTGELNLGYGSGTAAFATGAPSLRSLTGSSTSSRVTLAAGTTLSINQAYDSTFRGQIQGAGGIVKLGTGQLRLEATGNFTGGTTITAGTLDIATTGALGSGNVTLNGATSNLKLESGVTLANSILFGASGGRLSGHGAFSSNVALGTNSVIAPGSSVGTLTFTTGLSLLSGGSYAFEMQDALGGPGVGWDYVQVNGPLTFGATPIAPFALNLISLNSGGASGNPANFLSGSAYSWAIASATSFVNFNSSAVTINAANFTPALNGGTFSLSTSGTNLLLNFTPVPEPSTWALLLAGLGLLGFRRFRRRR